MNNNNILMTADTTKSNIPIRSRIKYSFKDYSGRIDRYCKSGNRRTKGMLLRKLERNIKQTWAEMEWTTNN